MYQFNKETHTLEFKGEITLDLVQDAITNLLPTLVRFDESWALADLGLALVEMGYNYKGIETSGLRNCPINLGTLLNYGKLLKEMVEKDLIDPKRPMTFAKAVNKLRESKGQSTRGSGKGDFAKERADFQRSINTKDLEIQRLKALLETKEQDINRLKKAKTFSSGQLTEKEIKVLLSFCHPDKFAKFGDSEITKKANTATQILNKINK